jgi:hypothetical protein
MPDSRIRVSAIRAAKWLAITSLLVISVFWSQAALNEHFKTGQW